MSTTPAAKTDDFKSGPLCRYLIQVLPVFVQNPFDAEPTLNVQKLHEALGKSHEAVYKWLRKSRVTPENAQALVGLANRADNVEILSKLGRKPPVINDFNEFVFGAAATA